MIPFAVTGPPRGPLLTNTIYMKASNSIYQKEEEKKRKTEVMEMKKGRGRENWCGKGEQGGVRGEVCMGRGGRVAEKKVMHEG